MIPQSLARLHKRTVVVRAAPFLMFVGFLMASSMVMSWFGADVGSGIRDWMAIGRGVLVALVLAVLWPAYSELRNPAPTRPWYWVIAVVAGVAVFVIWVALHQSGAVITASERFVPLLADGSLDWPKALMRLAGLGLVVPVMEELFWRSLILRWIEKHDFLTVAPSQVGFGAFVITTVLFAVEHDQWMAGAVAGIIYNLLYMRSGNLWIPILSHAVTNCLLGAWVIYSRSWQYW